MPIHSRLPRRVCFSSLVMAATCAALSAATWELLWAADPPQKTRRQKVLEDRERALAEDFWIYNDLPRAFAEARRSGKPLLVVLRCLPCEECVKLDDELVDRDPTLRPLLAQFVCARVVGTNGLDLATFQYDTDQSFAVFMLHGDGTIYGRFGTRSHRTEWLGDVSLPGLAQALTGALALHADYPANRASLAAKRGAPPLFASPELFPSLKDKFTAQLDYDGAVEQSCIHCHQIGDAQRDYYRQRREPLPESVLYPYPHPKTLGLVFDPDQMATLSSVAPGSWGAEAGFQTGDRWLRMAGQPLVSIADIQWVLQQTPAAGGTIAVDVERSGQRQTINLALPAHWRRQGDLSWRASSWTLRRMTTGGLVLEPATPEQRQAAGIADGNMALRVQYMGEYGEHGAGKRAGFQVDDLLVEIDGRTDLHRESDLFAYGMRERQAGDTLDVGVRRGAEQLRLVLPMQP